MKYMYGRLWVMLPADCDVCTGVVGDNSKNWTEGSVWADRQNGSLEEETNDLIYRESEHDFSVANKNVKHLSIVPLTP